MTIFHADVKRLSKYSPVMLLLSPATGVFNGSPEMYIEILIIS